MVDELLYNGPESGPVLVLAHGAGAPMDRAFMEELAELLGSAGVRVVRFEFPYMRKRREDGRRRPPDRQPVLLEHFEEVLSRVGARERPVVAGGKSMGGRMATMLAAARALPAVVCFGYPFHPSGRPERTRIEHLESLNTPVRIWQGERDPMGSRKEVEGYCLSKSVQLRWLPDGDHDLRPRRTSGHTRQEHLRTAAREAAEFIHRVALDIAPDHSHSRRQVR